MFQLISVIQPFSVIQPISVFQPISVLQRPVLNIAGVMNACEAVKNAIVVDKRAILLKIRAERAILLKIWAERAILLKIQAVL